MRQFEFSSTFDNKFLVPVERLEIRIYGLFLRHVEGGFDCLFTKGGFARSAAVAALFSVQFGELLVSQAIEHAPHNIVWISGVEGIAFARTIFALLVESERVASEIRDPAAFEGAYTLLEAGAWTCWIHN